MDFDPALITADRFPLITDEGRRAIEWMWTHPAAPRFPGIAGDRLHEADLARVRAFPPDPDPDWIARTLREVRYYRTHGPGCARADLSREPWSFVPDGAELGRLVVQRTGGTTGTPLLLPTHPATIALAIPLLRRALALAGVDFAPRAGRVAIVQLRMQPPGAATCAMVSSALDGAGFAKVNLHPGEWRDPDDRARYLDALDPEIYTGTPFAFAELRGLPLEGRPRALVSSSQPLDPPTRAALAARFGCPIIDLYGLTETGALAARADDGDFRVLAPDVRLELTEGELVVTSPRNPYLPLIQYRTGDHAAALDGDRLVALRGRHPLRYAVSGRLLHPAEDTP
jgi:phenylacetate-CoA ligase